MFWRPKVELPLFNNRSSSLMREVIDGVDKHDRQRRLRFVEFLSDEWYAAANGALKQLDTAGIELTVAYVSEVSSHCIVLSDGGASVSRDVNSADITLRQATDTTGALRQGSLSALTAIQEGLIAVEGEVGRLVAAKEALTAVDKILSGLTPFDPS